MPRSVIIKTERQLLVTGSQLDSRGRAGEPSSKRIALDPHRSATRTLRFFGTGTLFEAHRSVSRRASPSLVLAECGGFFEQA